MFAKLMLQSDPRLKMLKLELKNSIQLVQLKSAANRLDSCSNVGMESSLYVGM